MAYATDNFQSWQRALRDNHQALRSGLIVDNILPDFRPFLTDIEYSRVNDKTGNVQQVDELVRILLTKEHKHFESFCRVCERNGYQGWAKRLRASADGRQVPEGMSIQKIWSILKTLFEQMKHECPVFGVLVVGETGTGKSTLINNLIGEDIANEGNSLQSETDRISKYTMNVEGVSVALYDTPGLDDSRCTSDEEYLKKMRRILQTGAIKLVIYCFKLTETRMRRSLIRTFEEYNKIGMKWDRTVIALTFADSVKPPVKETKKQGFDMVHYFDDRVTMTHAEITKTLVEIVGVTQKDADHILCKPTTSDPDELLLNGKRWFVPLWLDILQLLSPPAALRLFEMNASKVEQLPIKDTGDSTRLPKSVPHSSMRRDVRTSSYSFPNRVVSAPTPTNQRSLSSASHGHHTYHISQTVNFHSATPCASRAHKSNDVRKLRLESEDEKRMGEILIDKMVTYTSKGAIIGGIAGAVVGLVGGPLGLAVGGTIGGVIGGAIGGAIGFFKSLIS